LLTNNDEKYHLNAIPNLSKIQNYIKYRRIKNGDVKNTDGVSEFVNEYQKKGIADFEMDEPMFFGEEYGNGSDENHFHLGLTSRYLLQNVRKSDFFHITYKIVKYNFPRILFGCTDIRRQFHIIAFMFTSHETDSFLKKFA
jgi:hypothetical protein